MSWKLAVGSRCMVRRAMADVRKAVNGDAWTALDYRRARAILPPMWQFFLMIAALLGLGGCQTTEPPEASPALWEVTGENGERGYLFGTIHALPEPVEWRSPMIDDALAQSDLLVVEAADIDDPAAMRAIYAELAFDLAIPPLDRRIEEQRRAALQTALEKAGIDPGQLAHMETWAVALALAQAQMDPGDTENGIDKALLATSDLPRFSLEGARAQLSIFDSLPEKEQRDLLDFAIDDTSAVVNDVDLAGAWRRGDIAAIAAQTETGMLLDPELREALLTRRNADWVGPIETMLRDRKRPFIAVGVAHLAGPESLQALLAARGWSIRRIQ